MLLGRQGPGQLNSGRVYPPSGLIDGDDLRDGAIDIDASIARELAEETGLAPGALARVARLHRCRSADGRSRSPSNGAVALAAEALRQRILDFIDADAEPELDDIVIVRQRADIDERTMPRHARRCCGRFCQLDRPR